jgi:hypothetical protein
MLVMCRSDRQHPETAPFRSPNHPESVSGDGGGGGNTLSKACNSLKTNLHRVASLISLLFNPVGIPYE